MPDAAPPDAGYVECACCGVVIVGRPGDVCAACAPCREAGEPVPAGDNWHCFTGHCEGSGCTYPGECEGRTR